MKKIVIGGIAFIAICLGICIVFMKCEYEYSKYGDASFGEWGAWSEFSEGKVYADQLQQVKSKRILEGDYIKVLYSTRNRDVIPGAKLIVWSVQEDQELENQGYQKTGEKRYSIGGKKIQIGNNEKE